MNKITGIRSMLFCSMLTVVVIATFGYSIPNENTDLSRFRYKTRTKSVVNQQKEEELRRVNALIEGKDVDETRSSDTFENPDPILSFSSTDMIGDMETPDGDIWTYTAKFRYISIPPHDEVVFTERLLQEYTFTIYDSNMNKVGTIKDKIHYREGEKRAPLCEITPVITRNFFNTDDDIEVMVAVGINPAVGYGVHCHSYVYKLGGEKDEDGYDKYIMVFNNLVGDIIQGPRSEDGADNFYFTFMGGANLETRADSSFWDRLVSNISVLEICGKAIDDKGPRVIHRYPIPILQYPGDQESVAPLISINREDGVYFLMQQYKEPFYNRYDDPMDPDLTQREGNSLVIDMYKADEEGLKFLSTTEIPVVLDRMINDEGQPTSLFSYYSVGNLRYKGDILFNNTTNSDCKPDYIITRSNYQPSRDGFVNSYFTYNNDGTLKNELSLYSLANRAMGDIEGFEPQHMFVETDSFGYLYKFVDLYTAQTASKISANYYYNDDEDAELLSSNCDRVPVGDSYNYVFELRFPLVDDNENDILRFMYINRDGEFNHIDYVNMGKGVAYAQSYLSTEALKPHAYTVSDTPAYMMLVKRGVEGSLQKIEELMVSEAESDENPEGKPLLILGPNEGKVLTSIVPEFAEGDRKGHILVYYYDSYRGRLSMDVYGLPLNEEVGEIEEITDTQKPILTYDGECVTGSGEIRVYSTDGKLILNGIDTIDLSVLEKGIYIIKSRDTTVKISN